MAYWTPSEGGILRHDPFAGIAAILARRMAGGFFALLTILLAARLLTWRIAYFDALAVYTDLSPAISAPAALTRWTLDYHDALLRGVLSDVLLAGLVSLPLALFPRWPRRIVLLAAVALAAANVEHVKYNHAHIALSALGDGLDPGFIRGSLSGDALKYAVAIGMALLACHVAGRRTGSGRWRIPFMVGLLVLALGAMPRPGFDAPVWMQSSPLMPPATPARLPADPSAPPAASLAPPFLPEGGQGEYNLLVVYLEGLSHASMARGEMRHLTALARTGIGFDNYISRQIITANGLYASLTGDTPSFLRRYPRWNALGPTASVARDALPHRLARQGYHTAYLQAAALDFMDKDSRMAALGFGVVRGAESWPDAGARTGWGIDDLTLMERTLAHIDDEIPATGPWFLSVLTSGTHSPYNVPGIAEPDRRAALRYADRAVATLIEGLRARDLLDTTTVIITSDEGREIETGAGMLTDLALNRLPLVVLHPDVADMRVSDYLMNTDLPGLALALTRPLGARDLEAALPRHTDLVFGNVITGKVFWYDIAERRLAACRLPGFGCRLWTGRNTLFGTSPGIPEPAHLTCLSALLATHDRAGPRGTGRAEKPDSVGRIPNACTDPA